MSGATPIEQLEKQLRADWPNLRKARDLAILKRQELSEKLSKKSHSETSIVVFGSLGRNEFTDDSDIDWTLLIDGKARSNHYPVMREVAKIIKTSSNKKVGEEGTFGSMAFSHDILHRIGGDDDTNKNTTQRILLLLESTPINDDVAWSRVMREVLTRYITEDWGIFSKEDAKDAIPRFLLNDIVRYWRTMCVDFAYKRRKGQGKGWGLRTVKLRLSRKLIYVSGLLACYSCALDNKLNKRIKATRGVKKRQQIMINYLYSRMRLTPLDILASTVIENKSLYQPVKQIIDSYDQFLAILSNKRKRNHLDKLKPEDSSTDKLFRKAKEIGRTFQEGLDQMFLEDNGTPLFSLTKKYGVF